MRMNEKITGRSCGISWLKNASPQRIKTSCTRYIHGESGATAIEYTLIAAGIALAIGAAVLIFGGDVAALFDYALSRFRNE